MDFCFSFLIDSPSFYQVVIACIMNQMCIKQFRTRQLVWFCFFVSWLEHMLSVPTSF